MVPSPLLRFCMKNNHFRTKISSLIGSKTSPMFFFAFKTATLAPELQVSMGPSPHLWFLHAKQRLLNQNYKSLYVPGLTYGIWIQNIAFSTRIASLYGSQSSSVVLCIHNSDILTRINSLCWSQTSHVGLCMQNRVISTRIISLHGSQTSPVVFCMQNNVISIRMTSLYGSQPSSAVFACKTATFESELQVSMGPRPHLWLLN